ncbi:MAG: zinc-ribbon domain-containing protein, partial [Myxococcota bacterium]
MRVSCPECGAEYQFASSAIPPEGYDAQCTNCSTVFFVEPEVTGSYPVPSDPDRIVTVGCPSCGAHYQFPAKDIPAGGYDAQCTQCNEVFFVSDEIESDENRVIGSPEPIESEAPSAPPNDLVQSTDTESGAMAFESPAFASEVEDLS